MAVIDVSPFRQMAETTVAERQEDKFFFPRVNVRRGFEPRRMLPNCFDDSTDTLRGGRATSKNVIECLGIRGFTAVFLKEGKRQAEDRLLAGQQIREAPVTRRRVLEIRNQTADTDHSLASPPVIQRDQSITVIALTEEPDIVRSEDSGFTL